MQRENIILFKHITRQQFTWNYFKCVPRTKRGTTLVNFSGIKWIYQDQIKLLIWNPSFIICYQENKKAKRKINPRSLLLFATHFIKYTLLKSCKPESNNTCLLWVLVYKKLAAKVNLFETNVYKALYCPCSLEEEFDVNRS